MAEILDAETGADSLDSLRKLGFSIAYRMLGTVADAEDIVQEALLRMHRASEEGTAFESARAYMSSVTTRLAIDHLRSARVRRETYTGTWLPEPVVNDGDATLPGHAEMVESVSMAFLTLLEALSPVERAIFLLREVFEYEYSEIAEIVDKSQDNCRQLFTRAKHHIDAGKPRFEASERKRDELAARFLEACQNGDLADLLELLSGDAVFYGDGGGKVAAVAHPMTGRDRVARLIAGIFSKAVQAGLRMHPSTINGQPGGMFFDPEKRLVSVFSVDIVDGRVTAIRSVINPDKLAHLGPVSDVARLRKPSP